jgi:hypothetical protein
MSDSLARADREVAILQHKVERLQEMVAAAEIRRARLRSRLADLAAGGTGDLPERPAEQTGPSSPAAPAAAVPRRRRPAR